MKDFGHFAREFADGNAAFGGARVYLVVDIGDVADISDVICPIEVAQDPEQHVEHDEHAAVADVQMVVDGRPAGIDAHILRIDGLEPHLLARQRVVEPELRRRRHRFSSNTPGAGEILQSWKRIDGSAGSNISRTQTTVG